MAASEPMSLKVESRNRFYDFDDITHSTFQVCVSPILPVPNFNLSVGHGPEIIRHEISLRCRGKIELEIAE